MDLFLNLAGFVLSLLGLFAAGLSKQWLFAVLACALIVTTGAAGIMEYRHDQELRQTEAEIATKLTINRWTAERIFEELLAPDKNLVQTALLEGVRRGAFDYQRAECTSDVDGSHYVTRVYFTKQKQPEPLTGHISDWRHESALVSGWIDLASPVDFQSGDQLRITVDGAAKYVRVGLRADTNSEVRIIGGAEVMSNHVIDVPIHQPQKQVTRITVYGDLNAPVTIQAIARVRPEG